MSTRAVPITVIRHLPFGLLVELEDRRTGVIRVREVSRLAEERQRWRELFPLRWRGRAVILHEENSDNLELSLRLVENDPWENAPARYRRGQILPGVVTGVMGYGAFVQIEAELTGLLHVSQFPAWAGRNPLDQFWPGDHVRVVIEQVDSARQRISLGLAPVQPPPASEIPAGSSRANPPSLQQATLFSRMERFKKEGNSPKYIVIIEDNNGQSEAIATWLRKMGQQAEIAATGSDGLALIEKRPPDLALIDLNLPDQNGVALARQVLERWPEVRCMVVTDWSNAGDHASEIENLQTAGVGLLLKPLFPVDLLDALEESGSPAVTGKGSAAFALGAVSFGRERESAQRTIHALMEQCRERTGFEAAFLFSLEPSKRVVDLVQRSGSGAVNKHALPSLIFSPVRDAAEDDELVALERLAESDKGRYRYLLEFYPFVACLGMPVTTRTLLRYALVLLDTHAQRISPEAIIFTQATALAIGALLERQPFLERAALIQTTTLFGQLMRGLGHEINNQLGTVANQLKSASNWLVEIQRNADKPAQVQQISQRTSDSLSQAQKAVLNLSATTDYFQKVLRHTKSERLRVDEVIEDAINMLLKTGELSNVAILWEPSKTLLVVRGQATAMGQVLVNVLLNAIQQVAAIRSTAGWVRVRVEISGGAAGEKTLGILVDDNGPGIHQSQWEQIFEPGFTTREDGSGLGLSICRGLMDAMGGKIYVAESFVLGGSTFVIELPWQV